MKITADEFVDIATRIAKRAAKAEPAQKVKLIEQLDELRTAAEKADSEGSAEIEVDLKKFESMTIDIVAAAERTATGGIAINVENLTKSHNDRIENLRKGLDTEGFPDDMNDPSFKKGELIEKNFGSDSWLQK